MATVKALSIRPVAWCEKVAHWLGQAIASDAIEDLIEMHLNGAQVFGVFDGPEMVGAYMVRIEKTAKSHEGVIVAAAGRAGVRLTECVIPYVESQFKKSGCSSIRLHTARPGLCKKAEEMGFYQSEIVMRKELSNGR